MMKSLRSVIVCNMWSGPSCTGPGEALARMVAELAATQREQTALFRRHWDQQQDWSKHRMQTIEKRCSRV